MSRVFFSSEVSHTSTTVQLSTGIEVDLVLTWRVAVSTYREVHGERMRDAEPELSDWDYADPAGQSRLSIAEQTELDDLVWRMAPEWAEELSL